jgi:iron complex outermembrane receptor protein
MKKQQLIAGTCACLLTQIIYATQVPEVTIKHDPIKPVVLSKPSPVIIITKKQIQKSGANSIAQVLASQSSIQLQDLTGDGSEVTVGMRGFGDNANNNTLILVNGIPQNNPDMATVNLNKIPVQNVDRIEILPGSQSVLYGDQAVAGTINIITKQPHKAHAALSMGLGNYRHQVYNFNVSNFYKNGFSYLLSGTADATQNYRRHNHDDQRNLLAELGYQYATGKVSATYNFYHQILQYAGALTAAQEAVNRRQEEPGAPNNNQHVDQHDASINLKQLLDPNWVLRNVFYYHDYYAFGNLYGAFKQKRRVFYDNPKMIGTYKHGTLTVGGDVQHDFYDLDSVSDYDKEHQYMLSAYSLWHEPFAKKFAYNIGARVAHMGNGGYHPSAFVTSLALLWHPNQDSSVYVRRAGNYRFPKAEENAELEPGITHLKTQTGASYDVGYKYLTQRYHAGIDLYYMRLRNEIVFDPIQTAQRPFGENRNLPPTNRKGINLSATYNVDSYLSLGGQYSYIDAVFRSGQDKGKRIPFVAADTFHLSSTLTFAPHWSLFAESIFMGKRYAASDDANVGKGIPSYVIFNASIGWHYQKVHMRLRVNNILNRYYNSYASMVTFNNVSTEYYYPAAGRTFMLTTSVDLW